MSCYHVNYQGRRAVDHVSLAQAENHVSDNYEPDGPWSIFRNDGTLIASGSENR